MIDLGLDISFVKDQIDPEITVRIDQEILLAGSQSEDCIALRYHRELAPGDHRLEIQYHNMTRHSEHDLDMAVIIDRVTFQSFDQDFKIYSKYLPEYPAIWLQQQTSLGQTPSGEIHSCYLGWNGIWFLDFQTPVYQWIHRRLNLGWLI